MVEKIPNGTVYRPTTPQPGGLTLSDGQTDYRAPRSLKYHRAGFEVLEQNKERACPVLMAPPHNAVPGDFFARLEPVGPSVQKIAPRRDAASCFSPSSKLVMIDAATGSARAANGTSGIPQEHLDAVNRTGAWVENLQAMSCIPGKIGQFGKSHVFGVYDKPLNHPETIQAIRRDLHEFRKYQDECYHMQNYYPVFMAIILADKAPAHEDDARIPTEFRSDRVETVALQTKELLDFADTLEKTEVLPFNERSWMKAGYQIDEFGGFSPREGRHSPHRVVNFLPNEALDHFDVTGQLAPFRTYIDRQEQQTFGSAIRPFGKPVHVSLSNQSVENTSSDVSETLKSVARGAEVDDTFAALLYYKMAYVKQLPLSEQYTAFSVIADHFQIFDKFKDAQGIYSEDGAHLFLHSWAQMAQMRARAESQPDIAEKFESKLKEFELDDLARKSPLAPVVAQIAAIAGPQEFDDDLVSRTILSPETGITSGRIGEAMDACYARLLDEDKLAKRVDRDLAAAMPASVKSFFARKPRIELGDPATLELIRSRMPDGTRDHLSTLVSHLVEQRKREGS
jgi:hypothetical protein